MFQGAPLLEDIGKTFNDDWFMPLAPTAETYKESLDSISPR
jgi:hypothetical protein